MLKDILNGVNIGLLWITFFIQYLDPLSGQQEKHLDQIKKVKST